MTRKIEAKVRALLDEYAQEAPPIDVSAIAMAVQAKVVEEALGSDVSGVLLRTGDDVIIAVNTAHHPRRQRFTIAHELGHYLLHRGRPMTVDSTVRLNWRNDLSSLATDKEEIEANAFAAELLMPSGMVRSAVQCLELSRLDDESRIVAALARKFDVSTEAMSYRLINLGIRS